VGNSLAKLKFPKGGSHRVYLEKKLMLDTQQGDYAGANQVIFEEWLGRLDLAVSNLDVGGLTAQFLDDSHWRDIVAMTWSLRTTSGGGAVALAFIAASDAEGACDFRVTSEFSPAHATTIAGNECIQAFFRFDTERVPCVGVIRLKRDDAGAYKGWTIMTAPDARYGVLERKATDCPDVSTNIKALNWQDIRTVERAYANHDPMVLIVGGGHAGCTSAAELKLRGIDALVVDREKRIGDNWRLRYHSLKLHNRTPINHFPLMPFPETFPAYIPKDKLANWIESYVDAMEVNFWTETSFEGAEYDEIGQQWSARLLGADGAARILRPKHIIMATSVSGTPNIPNVPTLSRFGGVVIHSSQFANGEQWKGRNALVIGTGTSAHDIAQNLHAHGADVSIVQRSPTMVINVDPSAQLYDSLYLGEGPPLAERDLVNLAVPIPVGKRAHQIITRKVKEIDAALLQGLDAAGFKLEFGEDDTGWPLKYRQRGGGYYFNAGCSDLIVNGEISVIQYADIDSFANNGAQLSSGQLAPADLVVLATGYMGQDYLVRRLFGDVTAGRVGKVWGLNPDTNELRNMWTPTGQPGLWFTAGSLSQCRIYSKYLAMQIQQAS
jgi:cation diffusion facilitator CzcD-associated flavoprotein CzcO